MKVSLTMLAVGLLICFALGGTAPAKDGENIFIGQKAPDFTLPAHTGVNITLSDYAGKKNVVIFFFPLAFTPV